MKPSQFLQGTGQGLLVDPTASGTFTLLRFGSTPSEVLPLLEAMLDGADGPVDAPLCRSGPAVVYPWATAQIELTFSAGASPQLIGWQLSDPFLSDERGVGGKTTVAELQQKWPNVERLSAGSFSVVDDDGVLRTFVTTGTAPATSVLSMEVGIVCPIDY